VDEHIEVQASVPGYKPEDVTVTVDAGVITITAQEQSEKHDAADGFLRRERYRGRLFRQVVLGDGVDGDKATAAFADGVLTVKVPMVAKPEPKRIAIQSGTTKAGKMLDGDSTS